MSKMKSLKTKTIVVRLSSDNIQEIVIDNEIFDDPYLEAATRAVENTNKTKYGIIKAVTECWEKSNPKKILLYNSYWILVNASFYKKAEMLREKFQMQYEYDLSKQPIHAKSK